MIRPRRQPICGRATEQERELVQLISLLALGLPLIEQHRRHTRRPRETRPAREVLVAWACGGPGTLSALTVTHCKRLGGAAQVADARPRRRRHRRHADVRHRRVVIQRHQQGALERAIAPLEVGEIFRHKGQLLSPEDAQRTHQLLVLEPFRLQFERLDCLGERLVGEFLERIQVGGARIHQGLQEARDSSQLISLQPAEDGPAKVAWTEREGHEHRRRDEAGYARRFEGMLQRTLLHRSSWAEACADWTWTACSDDEARQR